MADIIPLSEARALRNRRTFRTVEDSINVDGDAILAWLERYHARRAPIPADLVELPCDTEPV